VYRLEPRIDPYANDPGRWGASLVTLAEIVVPCLDAVRARSVAEIGAYAGDLTGVLLEWAAASGAQVWAIDPAPQESLVELEQRSPALELVRATSHDALRWLAMPDAVIVDGDHNYYTVAEELRLIAERADDGGFPLLLFHDVAWPHARRDDYYDPDRVPPGHRQPIVDGGGLFPGEQGIRNGGLPYRHAAAREGGPRNGVLTAVEDFIAERAGLRLAIVPAFFGLGVVWREDAPWSESVSELLTHWDRDPLLARLEANRVYHLAVSHVQLVVAGRAQERAQRQEAVLRRLLDSSAFALAERLSRLRRRAGIATAVPEVSKDEIRRALEG
jgi:Methyltransferase domain